jgi:hypothetical protein
MRPILVFLYPKAGMAYLNPGKAPFGAETGVRLSLHPEPPKSALYRIWVDTYLTT